MTRPYSTASKAPICSSREKRLSSNGSEMDNRSNRRIGSKLTTRMKATLFSWYSKMSNPRTLVCTPVWEQPPQDGWHALQNLPFRAPSISWLENQRLPKCLPSPKRSSRVWGQPL
uniref:Uncharacterized protein n=1 Tax=Cacopsylla melanoneura TaxID=428564 RepID=A0A8D8TD39_9HEMI